MRVLLGVALALSLAGCVSDPGVTTERVGSTEGGTSAPTLEVVTSVAVSDSTGSLSVSVVTDDLAPVDGALVAIADPSISRLTDPSGVAVFNDLAAGQYTVLASKPGYRTSREEGVLAEIVAGEVTQIKFVFSQIEVVTAETAYSETNILKGFIACGGYVRVVGDLNRCGQGVNVAGTWYLRDPNNNSTHVHEVDSSQIKDLWAEMRWTPTNDALGKTLRFWNYVRADCKETGCTYIGPIGGAGGSSPVTWHVLEGSEKNITGALAFAYGESLAYPTSLTVDVWPTAEPTAGQNVGASVFYQQNYDLLVTKFYGLEGPADFSAFPD